MQTYVVEMFWMDIPFFEDYEAESPEAAMTQAKLVHPHDRPGRVFVPFTPEVNRDNLLDDFCVLYRGADWLPTSAPWAFVCSAEDFDHAEEQCKNAYPRCEIVWVCQTDNFDAARADYYANGVMV